MSDYPTFVKTLETALDEARRAGEITAAEATVTIDVMERVATESLMNALDVAILRDTPERDSSGVAR